MTILSVEVLSSGICRVVSYENGTFYLRPDYLKTITKDCFFSQKDFNDDLTSEIIDAGLITACECKAVEYLSRAEQCRFGLIKKLTDKGYNKAYIEPALDYLEKMNYLSDIRFARSWLNTRKINHAEGKAKLLVELTGRGILKETAVSALDDFFSENDEKQIAEKCFSKLKKKGKTGDKLISAMIQQGFSYKTAVTLENNGGVFPEE